MANEIGKLQVVLEAQTASFEKGMAQATASLKRLEDNSKKTQTSFAAMAGGMAKAGLVAAGAALAGMAKSLIDAADAAQDTAVAFGTTIDRIYAYKQAMVEAGGSADGMDKALQKLADQVDSAFEGTDSAVQAFERLGISMESMKNQQLDKIFERVTKALEKETDATKRNAIAKDLLGKAVINTDYETFNKAIETSAEKYANLRPHLEAAAQLSDDLARIWKSFTTYLTAGVGAVATTVGKLKDGFVDIYNLVTGKKSIAEAMAPVAEKMEKAAPAIERVAKATQAQTKAATDAQKALDELNKVIAKQVEEQIKWEQALLDSINPMNEIDRNLARLQVAMDSGRLSADQYAEAFFKITDQATKFTEKKDALDEMGVAIGNTLSTGVGQLVDGFFEANQSFSEFAANFLKNIAKMIAQLLIMNAIKTGLKGTSAGSWLGFAQGGAFGGATGLPHGIYNQPTFFNMPGNGPLQKFAKGGVLGEAGPEAILPLRRGAGGSLGVAAAPTTINVINNAGVEVSTAESNNSDGAKQIDIIIERKVKDMFGQGAMDKQMRANYGLKRSAA